MSHNRDNLNASPSATELKRQELLDVLEIGDLTSDTHPNQALTLRESILNLDIEHTEHVIQAVKRAKNIYLTGEH
ncbi:hypothetical protein [Streptomyces sp. NPDC020747]|uniref:hypothetical protein n=1 Tax=Streptomyces sp. NPDC020747 TaxID=3365086 RepID=UPI00379107E6